MKNFQNIIEQAKKYQKELILAVAFVVLVVVDCIHCAEIEELKAKVQQNMQKEQNEKVYVYNVNRLISSSPQIVALQQKYKQQMAELDKQIDVAQQKLANMKDKAAKAEFSEAYLGGLSLKRDNLLEEYQKAVAEVSERTNKALLDIVNNNKIPVVYNASIIAVNTTNVVDLTDAVLKNSQK